MSQVKSLDQIREIVHPILSEYGVEEMAVFGSYARGEAKPGSDLDLLVEFPPKTSLFDVVAAKRELEEALGIGVDLVEREALKPIIKDKVLAQQRPLV